MTRVRLFVTLLLLGGALYSATPGTAAQDAANPAKLDITVKTLPSPAKHGENKFEVTVKDASGKPLTDIDVSLQLTMPAMPAMSMPEMKTDVTLKADQGKFTGTGQLGMAGNWNVTVTVKKDGKQLAEKQSTMTAK